MKMIYVIGIGTVLVGAGALTFGLVQRSKKKKKRKDEGIEQQQDSVGMAAFPSGEYANVRSAAQVNTGIINNQIGTVKGKEQIGIVTNVKTGEDNYKWYTVKLTKPIGKNAVGYVREDVVKLVPATSGAAGGNTASGKKYANITRMTKTTKIGRIGIGI